MDYIGGIIFSNFGVRHVASQRFLRKSTFLSFLDHIVIVLDFFEVKKTRNVIWRRMVCMRAREVPYLTIW